MGLKLKTKTARAVEARALEGVDPAQSTKYKRRILIRLAMEHGKFCEHCNRPVKFIWEPGVKKSLRNLATFDHRLTKRDGGRLSFENGILSCRVCNNLRATNSVEDYRRELQEVAGGNADKLQWIRRNAAKERRTAIKEARQEQRELTRRVRKMPWYIKVYNSLCVNVLLPVAF